MRWSTHCAKSREGSGMNTDERYMRMALALARRAEGMTYPNPTVGAVIVKSGKVVGSGYHKRCGLPHAEVNALTAAGARAKGATLYVTLEPCDHFGRTPPCTEAIIAAGIKKVVIGMKDPNPITNGMGIKRLRRAGIKTSADILADEAALLNRPFIKFITKNMPYVTVKVAESIDGKIATKTGDSRWISGDDSRRYVHRLRRKAQAVMVGANTAAKDDPSLLSQAPGARQPARIIVDSGLRVSPGLRIFRETETSPVIVATTKNAARRKARVYEAKGATVLGVRSKGSRVDARDLMKRLARMDIIDILVEGGGELIADLVGERLVDRFLFFIAPKIIGGRDAVTPVEGAGVKDVKSAVSLKNVKIRRFKRDILVMAEVS